MLLLKVLLDLCNRAKEFATGGAGVGNGKVSGRAKKAMSFGKVEVQVLSEHEDLGTMFARKSGVNRRAGSEGPVPTGRFGRDGSSCLRPCLQVLLVKPLDLADSQ